MEWPEIIQNILPLDTIQIKLEITGDTTRVCMVTK